MKRLTTLVLSLAFLTLGAISAQGAESGDNEDKSGFTIPADATDEQIAVISDKMACYA